MRENIDEIYLGPNWSTSEAYLNCRGFWDVSGCRIVVVQSVSENTTSSNCQSQILYPRDSRIKNLCLSQKKL